MNKLFETNELLNELFNELKEEFKNEKQYEFIHGSMGLIYCNLHKLNYCTIFINFEYTAVYIHFTDIQKEYNYPFDSPNCFELLFSKIRYLI